MLYSAPFAQALDPPLPLPLGLPLYPFSKPLFALALGRPLAFGSSSPLCPILSAAALCPFSSSPLLSPLQGAPFGSSSSPFAPCSRAPPSGGGAPPRSALPAVSTPAPRRGAPKRRSPPGGRPRRLSPTCERRCSGGRGEAGSGAAGGAQPRIVAQTGGGGCCSGSGSGSCCCCVGGCGGTGWLAGWLLAGWSARAWLASPAPPPAPARLALPFFVSGKLRGF